MSKLSKTQQLLNHIYKMVYKRLVANANEERELLVLLARKTIMGVPRPHQSDLDFPSNPQLELVKLKFPEMKPGIEKIYLRTMLMPIIQGCVAFCICECFNRTRNAYIPEAHISYGDLQATTDSVGRAQLSHRYNVDSHIIFEIFRQTLEVLFHEYRIFSKPTRLTRDCESYRISRDDTGLVVKRIVKRIFESIYTTKQYGAQ